jgi:hypothetical protein
MEVLLSLLMEKLVARPLCYKYLNVGTSSTVVFFHLPTSTHIVTICLRFSLKFSVIVMISMCLSLDQIRMLGV